MQSDKAAPTYEVTIEKLVYGGSGFARHEGKVVFVPYAAPGDRLRVRTVEEKKTYRRAAITEMLQPGSGRMPPQCRHFAQCGGCDWQHLEYSAQVAAKQQILEELFHHRFPQTRQLPILMRPCPQPFGYRSRARVQLRGCGPEATVGFFRSGSHSVEDVEHCPLFRPSLNEALGALRRFKASDRDGASQEVDLACSEEDGAWATEPSAANLNRGLSTPIESGGREVLLKRRIGDHLYAVTASVFFQANDYMVAGLIDGVMEYADSAGSAAALDLFSGVGLFTLPLARRFQKVVAVESSQPSCRLCEANASAAGMQGIQIQCADVARWMQQAGAAGLRQWDLIVLDPPRTGTGPNVMESILRWSPPAVIYVSCDPQTLVRDLARITPQAYRIDRIQGLDMFPQTYHFETIVKLVRT